MPRSARQPDSVHDEVDADHSVHLPFGSDQSFQVEGADHAAVSDLVSGCGLFIGALVRCG